MVSSYHSLGSVLLCWMYASVEFGIVIATKALGSSRNDFDVMLMRDLPHLHTVVRDWFATSFVYLGGKL